MQKTGAQLVVHALEAMGVRFTFGIPGVHNTELYDELGKSEWIEPILVTHEGGAAFMADAISRTTGQIGTLVIVPAAGATHALSGIAEAFLDGIPMLIISGGVRTDSGRHYQLHMIDQEKLVGGAVKKYYKITDHKDIVPTLFAAFELARAGEPGPVFVEIPVNILLFTGNTPGLPPGPEREVKTNGPDPDLIARAARQICQANRVGLFLGWGARDAVKESIALAEELEAPVATTLQGLSVFPGNHPLFAGMGYGMYSVPAADVAFADCDCLIAVGTRFAEIPTGSFSMKVPEKLIHIDINPDVFHKNYPATVAIKSDAAKALPLLLQAVKDAGWQRKNNGKAAVIAKARQQYLESWLAHDSKDRVNPARFFQSLRRDFPDNGILVVDDGNHTFLTEELFPVHESKCFLSPTDFNCMGYAVPAAIGTRLAHPEREVAAIVGDGAFLMTCMEILTATSYGLGIVYYVFHDGELSQISQGQEIPYNRKTCTVLGKIKLDGIAHATGAHFLSMPTNDSIDEVIARARELSAGNQPVIVDVNIDYSRRTRFTQGVVKANLGRFPLREKARFILRALTRKITG